MKHGKSEEQSSPAYRASLMDVAAGPRPDRPRLASRSLVGVVLFAIIAMGPAACGTASPAGAPDGSQTSAVEASSVVGLDAAALDPEVDAILAAHDDGIEASLWVGGESGPAWYERAADVWRPAASSIKSPYLIELFAHHAGSLDEPLPGAVEVVGDAEHPAIAHFDAETQEEIREYLAAATVREVGIAMIRGTGVSNAVYNAAANLTTAAFGGPESLTALIRARDDSFAGVAVRRYMLAARDVTGDNEATAASLAAVLQRLARGDLPGVDAATVEAIREVMYLEDDDEGNAHFFKGGSLDSDPLTRVRSGWLETPRRTIVYVVMVEQPGPGSRRRNEAGRRLADTAERLAETVLQVAAASHDRN